MNKALFVFTLMVLSIVCIHAQPSEPILLSPAFLAEDVNPEGTTLNWIQPGLIMMRYFFEVSLDLDPQLLAPPVYMGPALEFYNGDFFMFPTPPLIPEQTYFWRVKVIDMDTMLYALSPMWIFHTGSGSILPPEPPMLVSPPDGSGGYQPNEVELVWIQNSLPPDSFFDVFMDIDPAFSDPIVYSNIGTPLGGNQFGFLVPDVLTEDAYFWYVRITDLATGLFSDSSIWTYYVIPSSTISGTVSSSFNVSAVTVSCPQACVPNSVTIGLAGTFTFTVNNGLNPVVTPFLGWPYYFSPGSYTFNNIQANQTANFWMYSLLSNPPFAPIPANLADDVSININQLKWSFTVLPGYSPPTNFAVYFPASASQPYAVVPYMGRDPEYSVDIPVLNSNTLYDWKVVPYNEEGPAEGVEVWTFNTEDAPGQPVLVFPPNGALNIPAEGVTVQFEQPGWIVDSFFDVFCDIDPEFPNPPAHTGPLTPVSGNLFEYHLTPLIGEHEYFWKVRYTAGETDWTSAIFNFVTGVSAAPQSKLSGYIQNYGTNSFAVWDVKMSCPGACVPKTYKTSFHSGYYEFTVTNGSDYTVYPSKWTYYFTPASYTFTNVQSNQTKNFYISSWQPRYATQPVPPNLATGVSVNIGQLQWSYFADQGYALPTGFEVYFPASSPEPYAVVPYMGRDPEYAVDIPLLEYSGPYEWKVMPFNENGPADSIMTWYFETEPPPILPPTPQYIYPIDLQEGLNEVGLIMAWDSEGERRDFPVDSFFDVYCDIDPGFPNPPIYSGPDSAPPDPHNPGYSICYVPPLQLGTLYYWKVRVTDPATGLSSEGEVWSFSTAINPVIHPIPLPLFPINGDPNVPPDNAEVGWDFDPWNVDSFFDIFCDTAPGLSSVPVYSGPGTPRFDYLFHLLEPLLRQQQYFWNIRFSNFAEFWYTESPVWMFTTSADEPPPSPILFTPPNLAEAVPHENVEFTWTCDPDWWVDSFFDVFCDIDPGFPSLPICSAFGSELFNDGIFSYTQPNLLPGETYHWYVRLTDLQTELSSDSPVWTFTTEQSTLPSPVLFIAANRTLNWSLVFGADYYRVYKSLDPYGEFLPVWITPDNFWIDPDESSGKAFYRVTAVTADFKGSESAPE